MRPGRRRRRWIFSPRTADYCAHRAAHKQNDNGYQDADRHERAVPQGHILNMSSVAGHHVGAASGVYSATKFFIAAMTESLRTEVSVSDGIQVSMISPGVIDTGWQDKVDNAGGKEAADKLIAGAISPESVADAVAYALDQPKTISIGDIVIAPTRQDW